MASEFSKILAGCKDITDDVYNDPLHYQTAEVLDLFERSQPALAEMRHFVEGCFMTPDQWNESSKDSLPDVGFLCNLQDWFDYYDPEIQQYRDDLFAIDATDSPLIQTLVGQFYEVIVAGIGYTTSMSDPQVFRAQATPALAGKKGFSFDQLIESLTIQDRSWPNTFREYKERELALNCSSQSVIVDGPILTQNLITQPDGEKLTEKILKSGKRVVGVIKNLSASSPEEQISGQVLKDGEAYIITDCRTLLQKRNKTWASSKNKAAWMERVPAKYCRGVYRPGNPTTGQSKYFGFECRIDQLHWALAMMYGERSDTPGHEIPFLLDHVDAFLDGCHDRSSVQARLESVVMEHNPGQAFDLIDSDDFRGK